MAVAGDQEQLTLPIPEALDAAREHLEASIALDPGFARAHSALAGVLVQQVDGVAVCVDVVGRSQSDVRVPPGTGVGQEQPGVLPGRQVHEVLRRQLDQPAGCTWIAAAA